MENLVWRKFPGELLGADLKIALESTFPKVSTPVPNPNLVLPKRIPSEMDYPDREIIRYYHPATERRENSNEIVFLPRFCKDGELFKRLVFRRKEHRGDRDGHYPMMLARFGEEKPFGFSCWKPGERGNQIYVALAFPTLTRPGVALDHFIPVYARIDTYPLPCFLEIKAEETEEGVKIAKTHVSANAVPTHLL